MKKTVRILALALALAMVVLSFASCGGTGTTEPENSTSANATEAGAEKLVFGTNAEFPPFEFIAPNGLIDRYDGIDIAIAKQIGEDNGMTAEISNMEFDSLIISLNNGTLDAVIAGMTITDERKESVDFSIPYYTATQVMIVKDGSGIKSAADMADKRIAVVQGYTGETAVQDLGYKYEAFKKGTECVMELVNGKCDVVVIDSATAAEYVGDNEGLVIIEDNDAFGQEEYGVAVAKGNTKVLNMVNATIEKMLAEGTIADLAVKYIEEM